MLTSISINLINRVKYQLCQSQKWKYHLCGDELCACREFISVDSFGSCKFVVIWILNINTKRFFKKIDKKMSPPEITGIRQALELELTLSLATLITAYVMVKLFSLFILKLQIPSVILYVHIVFQYIFDSCQILFFFWLKKNILWQLLSKLIITFFIFLFCWI